MAEALDEAKMSLRMTKYIDGSRLLTQAIQMDSHAGLSEGTERRPVNEDSYAGLFGLLTNGFDQLLPIEQALLYESYLRTPLHELLPRSSGVCQ